LIYPAPGLPGGAPPCRLRPPASRGASLPPAGGGHGLGRRLE